MNRRAAETAPNVEMQTVVPVTASAAAWQVVGAVVRGVSHERLGLPCQDAQETRVLPDGTLLVALADGAGSASFSDQGARCAVNEALNSLAASLEGEPPADADGWRCLLREVFDTARAAVIWLAATNAAEDVAKGQPAAQDSPAPEDMVAPEILESFEDPAALPGEEARAASEPPPERAYATTLTCAIATRDQLVVGQIGDGVVVAGEGERLFSVTRLQRGEYANETHFLTQPGALEQLLVEVIEHPVRELAVMSDGLIRLALKMPEQEPFAPFFRPLFRVTTAIGLPGGAPDGTEAARQLAVFLGSERVNARTDDDKSLVLAVRSESLRESVEQSLPEERTMEEDGIRRISGSFRTADSPPMRDAEQAPPSQD